jgi:hypothetical protein
MRKAIIVLLIMHCFMGRFDQSRSVEFNWVNGVKSESDLFFINNEPGLSRAFRLFGNKLQ